MDPIEPHLWPKLSRRIVLFLRQCGWSDTRIARVVRRNAEFVNEVAAERNRLAKRQVQAIARAIGVSDDRFLFDVLQPSKTSPLRELWESTLAVVEASEVTSRRRRPATAKKKRAGKSAA